LPGRRDDQKDLDEVATWLTYKRDYLAEAERLVSRNTPETVALKRFAR
jgi:hypothetical protein